jgi:xanthine dehydrogenase accessory factor
MREPEQILQLWDKTASEGQPGVLATVVKTQGSSYRLPGARLLLTSEGQRAGSISGGCLEDDLVKKAFWFTERGPVVRRYDTTPDGEIGTGGFGLGCNGIIHVLLQRLDAGNDLPLALLRKVRTERRPALIAHSLERPELKLSIDTDGVQSEDFRHPQFSRLLDAEARAALAAAASAQVTTKAGEFFLEVLRPANRLLIFGAGDDAIPLVEQAKYLGWEVFVYDGRAHYARPEKFPTANGVSVHSATDGTPVPSIDQWTVAVLMTHSYQQDSAFLQALAAQPLRYLGILGPRKRAEQMFVDAGLDPLTVPARIHSPMGLDVGADGPEQVALSVIAEIQATINGREGGRLRNRSGSIHAPESEGNLSAGEWTRSIACA